MPPENRLQPQIGSLVRCRVSAGTFSYTTTRHVIQIKDNGKSFVLEGARSNPIVQANDILAVLTTFSLTAEKQV